MTPEERSLLERTYNLAEENNVILRKIRRVNRFSLAFRIVYWTVVIGLAVGALYFIQPYVDAVVGTYTDLFGRGSTNVETTQNDTSMLLDLLK